MEQHQQRKFPSVRAPAAAVPSPLHPGAPGDNCFSGPPPLPCLKHNVVNTRRSPGQRAPPPGPRRTSWQVMNGFTMPSSFSHTGTRRRAPQRRRFNTAVTATANRINGPPVQRKKGAHASQASPKRLQTGPHNPFFQVDSNAVVALISFLSPTG